jgi:hypothetical protein
LRLTISSNGVAPSFDLYNSPINGAYNKTFSHTTINGMIATISFGGVGIITDTNSPANADFSLNLNF